MADDITGERWLPIPGYEGRYDVSDHGRVRSWVPLGRPGSRPPTDPRILAAYRVISVVDIPPWGSRQQADRRGP